MDEDLDRLTHSELLRHAKAMRSAIRRHRDAAGHDLCWYHPELWALLPDAPTHSAPPPLPCWAEFMQGCVRYRQSLEQAAPDPEAPLLKARP
jgi:hypothetical protein